MWYLIEQYFWFILAAFVVGLIVGWWNTRPDTSSKDS